MTKPIEQRGAGSGTAADFEAALAVLLVRLLGTMESQTTDTKEPPCDEKPTRKPHAA